MNKLILASAAMLGLSGCVGLGYGGGYDSYGGYGSGVSVGVSSGYGGYGGYGGYSGYGGYGSTGYGRYGGSGYGGYGTTGYGTNGYGGGNCIATDPWGRAYYTCGFGSYYGSNRYVYSPGTAVYYYPGYAYRDGYYYDGYNRRYDGQTLYHQHYGQR